MDNFSKCSDCLGMNGVWVVYEGLGGGVEALLLLIQTLSGMQVSCILDCFLATAV